MSFVFFMPLNALTLSGTCLGLGIVYFFLYHTALKRPRQTQGGLLGPKHFCLFHLLKYLQAQGAKLDVQDKQGQTALNLAITNGHQDVAAYLQEVAQ